MITAEQLQAICMTAGGRAACLAYLDHLNRLMPAYGIDTPARVAAFLAQVAHESADFTRVTENLNYSAAGLAATWPNRYRGPNGQPNAIAQRLRRDPEAIANHCYASRMGNGDEASGEGWRYRGRGLKQLTGKDNYRACGLAVGVDLLARPELLETPAYAVEAACWFWRKYGLSAYADRGDFEGLTRRVNGGLHGLVERQAYLARAERACGVEVA